MGKLRILILTFSFAFFAFSFTLVLAQDKIIAVVNSDIITQKDLNDFLNFMRMQMRQDYSGKELETKIQSMKLDLINKLIEDRLILQEAKRYGIIVDESRVRAKIDEIRRKYPTEADFQNSLKQQGLVQADLEAKIKEQFLMYNCIEYKIRSKIAVTPTEVTEFYQKNAAEFNSGETRNFSSLNSGDEKVAWEAYRGLKNGASFDQVSEKYSLSINKFNDIHFGELKKEIENEVFKLKIDEFSEPVKIKEDYFIFKLESIVPTRQLNLNEARDKIHSYLLDKKSEEAMVKWLDELKKLSYVKLIQE